MPQINAVTNPFVPDAYINIVSPSVPLVGDVQTDLIAVVGTASWGPVNAVASFSDPASRARIYGPMQARKYDLATACTAAMLQGAQNFVGVRVTDGTDVAASVVIGSTGITLTSIYTGSLANGDTATIAAGSAASTVKVTLSRAGRTPEVFDNIAGSGNALWVNIANAINNGQSGLRGPSTLMVAAAGASTSAPTNGSYTLASGTDGTATITAAVLLGADTGTRTGMYALRGIGPHMLVLADADASSSWPAQVAFALSELGYAMLVGPAGEYTAPATVTANLATAGIDSYGAKYLVGDWCYLVDTENGGVERMISPQGFAAGILAVRGPEQSGLNKPMQGITGTQKSKARQKYSVADLAIFGAGRCDVITTPLPGFAAFGLRQGRNTSSNAAISGDNYSRLSTYYPARLATVAGQIIGMVNTVDEQTGLLAAVDVALHQDWIRGRLSNPKGTQPYSLVIDNSRAALGVQKLNAKLQYGPIITVLEVNLEGGQTVQIASQFQPAA